MSELLKENQQEEVVKISPTQIRVNIISSLNLDKKQHTNKNFENAS